MSSSGLLRHLERCNRFDAKRFRPLLFAGRRIGLVRDDNAALLARFPETFAVGDCDVTLVARGGFDELSDAVDRVVEALVADGAVSKWRYESFAVTPVWGETPVFKIDRGAVPVLGVRAYGVHLNGWRRDGAGRIRSGSGGARRTRRSIPTSSTISSPAASAIRTASPTRW